MLKKVRHRLTYANVMATVAVFIALGGGAYAASQLKKNSVGSKQIKKNAVTGAKVKNNSLTGSDVAESTLGRVPAAASAEPAAFAHVSSDGVLDQARSKNVGSVALTGTSTYCFSGLPFTPRGGQATIDELDSAFQSAQFVAGTGSSCQAGTQAFVFTIEPGSVASGKGSPAAFYVVFYR